MQGGLKMGYNFQRYELHSSNIEPNMESIMKARLLAPTSLTFIGSLILSLVAVYFEPILGRDASLYIENAYIYVNEGAATLLTRFSWPWISALIGLTHEVTGLPMIASGYIWVFLFTAGTCAVLVRCVELLRSDAGYWAMLVVLTMPAFNEYRYQIVRDHGFWFFSSCVLLSMMLFESSRQWRYCLIGLICVLLAAIFRLEAVFMFVSMALAIGWAERGKVTMHPKVAVLCVVLAMLAMAGTLFALHTYSELVRVDYYLSLIDPQHLNARVHDLADTFAQTTLHETARDDALLVLIFGFSMVILYKLALMMGPFVVAFVAAQRKGIISEYFCRHTFATASAFIYFLILLMFFLQERFMVDRYIVLLNILVTPSVVLLLLRLWSVHRKIAIAVVVISVLVGLSNVVSLSSKRTHYLDAAEWIESNVPETAKIYFYDERIGFYSGRGVHREELGSRDTLDRSLDRYDYFFVDLALNDPMVQARLKSGALIYRGGFDNGDNRALIILAKPGANQEPVQPSP